MSHKDVLMRACGVAANAADAAKGIELLEGAAFPCPFECDNVYDSIGSAPAVNPGGADENSGRSIADRMR